MCMYVCIYIYMHISSVLQPPWGKLALGTPASLIHVGILDYSFRKADSLIL